MNFSQYVLVGTNMVHLCIAEFLTCPVYLKMFIVFRDHFFDVPSRQRIKARRKLGFGFGLITSDLDAFPPKGIQPSRRLFHKCDKSKTLSTKRPGFDLGCHFQCTFKQLL